VILEEEGMPMEPTPPLEELLDFALEAAWLAGRLTLGYFQTGLRVERKSDNSPVTIADREAEKLLRERIAKVWPDHGIIGEEFGRQPGAGAITWIIDPIDGTKSFIHGVPFYSVLVAAVDASGPVVGVAHYPALNDTIYAARGAGCYWNGRRARVSTIDRLEDATLLFSDVIGYGDHQAAYETLVQATAIQRTWGDSYGYALVATGRAEIMLDPIMNIWDCAPFGVIMAEAGGTFTDWHGRPSIDAGESIGTNGILFDAVMAITRR
jgi:histidinol-phosphate phosphatase (EC 3.1.3.15)